MKYLVATIALALLLAGGWLFYLHRSASALPEASPTTPAASSTAAAPAELAVQVSSPAPNSLIADPVAVSGQARGNWFFEATLPVRVLDAAGKELGRAGAQAQGDWMTADFVPFSATVSYVTSTTATGYLVVEKDNPSGLEENAASVTIPIRFR